MEEVCVVNDGEVVLEDVIAVRNDLKRHFQCLNGDDAIVDGSPRKKQAKEAVSSDDAFSGISDAGYSNDENVLNRGISGSPPVESEGDSGAGSGEMGSTGSSVCEDRDIRERCSSGGESISDVVLELPKEACSMGIRKITFKFGKVKKECDDGVLVSGFTAQSFSNKGVYEGDSYVGAHKAGCCSAEFTHVKQNKEMKMSKKVVLDTYPTNVKKLLSTGILEGARVKYVSSTHKKEIPGVVRGYRYLCGCSTCDYSKVVSAYEFELHAGAKTRHPNNHIFLENGRLIFDIIETLKTTPPGMLVEVVKDIAGPSVNEGSFRAWKEHKRKPVRLSQSQVSRHDRGAEDRPRLTSFEENMLSKHRYFATSSIEGSTHPDNMLNSHATSCLVHQKKESGGKGRDNELHRLLFTRNGLPDGAELAYYFKGQKLLQGYKRGRGIVCGHCDREISPSQFEAHAGCGARRQPYHHIYTSNGTTLHDIAMSLQNGHKLSTGQSDDMCTVCGEQQGKLILCSRCPRVYHAACLGSEYVSIEDDWRCPCCSRTNSVIGDSSSNIARPLIIRLTCAVEPIETETGGCVICRQNHFSDIGFDDRTVIICDQCEKEYHIGCLRDNEICDLKELPADKWFCCQDCNRIHLSLIDHYLKGAEFPPSSAVEAMNKKLAEKGLCGVAENNVQWLLISGKNHVATDRPLLSMAVSIFRECFSPIVTNSGRDLIPVMVYGRNISGQDFENMYTIVLIVNSVVVSAALLRVFSSEVAELPMVATSKENQGKGFFLVLFSCIQRFLCSLKVQNLVLPAAEEAKSIWTNKFGFRAMSREQLSKYTSVLTLTGFQGTYWLEKALEEHPT
ncbi:hypothetical protein Droror1_Dr00014377 [Drosera rotundifolia]